MEEEVHGAGTETAWPEGFIKMQKDVLLKTELPLPLFIRGKVRDTYDMGDYILIVVTDRISAFDVILPCGIPQKGKVLNQLSSFWFDKTKDVINNHVVAVVNDAAILNDYLPKDKQSKFPAYLNGRSMLVKKAKRLPIECVVRGYISGSAWSEYVKSGTVSGIKMPSGLLESQKLGSPIFTPTTKAEQGHDLPMTMSEVEAIVGKTLANEIKHASIDIYNNAVEYAGTRGFIIADTKFEFGIDSGKLIIIDEMLTPDSSRFWEAAKYKAGQSQDSYDKQIVRDWLSQSGWNKEPPGPVLPDDVIEKTAQRYIEAYEKLTGRKFDY
ncbi:MAG: phosphoribosylaminoimidazolesuccinocarboxamide synthase [Dehalococcoidales bacterium]|nr:phosphoribosylaminoimidazolesuccinocarboxamide synthase [Dehalococcoidales bacterium]